VYGVKARFDGEDERMAARGETDFLGCASTSGPGLRTSAFLLCGDWFLADDLVQEALTRVFGVWGRVSGSGDPGPYARKVLVNLYLDHRRRPARREIPTADLPDGFVEQPNAVDGDRDRLMAALRQVPKGQRAVLVLRFWDDLSIEQTAQIVGTTASNVRSQASRGLETLRAVLGTDHATTTPKEAL
jgi:RNA polymerase sigma-70 factor (sigma-E family)